MQRFIGLDVHSASCTAVVLNGAGKRLRTQVLETHGGVLRDFVRSLPRPRYLCIEEGAQSEWVYELCETLVDQLIVVQPQKRQGVKDDNHDAYALADQHRAGRLQGQVYKNPCRFTELRQAVRAYEYAQKDVVRLKNRLKAQLRARGMSTAGNALYDPQHRVELLKELPSYHRHTAQLVADQLDAAMPGYLKSEAWLLQAAKRVPIVRRLGTAPGIGAVRGSQIVATVVSPQRFRTRRQFWSYCGLAVVTHSSSDWVQDPEGIWVKQRVAQTRGLNRHRNPRLKAVFKGAAMTVVTHMPNHPLHHDYQKLVDQGTRPTLARLTLARRIAGIVLAMWKHQEDYQPQKHVHITP